MFIDNSSVEMISFQIVLPDGDTVPEWVSKWAKGNPWERTSRRDLPRSDPFLSGRGCSARGLVRELENEGFKLVHFLCRNDPHWELKFAFAHGRTQERNPEILPRARVLFQKLCEASTWQMKAFVNPWYRGGRKIEDQCKISTVFKFRQEMVEPVLRLTVADEAIRMVRYSAPDSVPAAVAVS